MAGRQKKSVFYFNFLKSLTLLKGIVKKLKIKQFDSVWRVKEKQLPIPFNCLPR